jgi:hypothetical protein
MANGSPQINSSAIPVAGIGGVGMLAFALAAILAIAVPSAAQDETFYISGGPMLSTQAAGQSSGTPDQPTSGIGGTAFGAVVTVGRTLSPRVSVAAEVSIPARFVAVQELHYSFSALYENQYRDAVFSGLFHFHTPNPHRVRPEVVAGLSVIHQDNLQRTANQAGVVAFPPTGMYGPFGAQSQQTSDTFGVTVGLDVCIAVSRRLSIVPQARVHWISRDPSSGLFLDSLVVRPAVALRATF